MLHLYSCIHLYAGRWLQFRCAKDKLHKYADYQDMIIAGEYSDEGKSSKSVEGRPQFQVFFVVGLCHLCYTKV